MGYRKIYVKRPAKEVIRTVKSIMDDYTKDIILVGPENLIFDCKGHITVSVQKLNREIENNPYFADQGYESRLIIDDKHPTKGRKRETPAFCSDGIRISRKIIREMGRDYLAYSKSGKKQIYRF